MKRKIIKFIGLALFAGAIAFNLYLADQNQNRTSKVTLQNIAALTAAAEDESGGDDNYYDDRYKKDIIETTYHYFKVHLGVHIRVFSAFAEYDYKKEITEKYSCCHDGGGRCPKKYPKCENT